MKKVECYCSGKIDILKIVLSIARIQSFCYDFGVRIQNSVSRTDIRGSDKPESYYNLDVSTIFG